MKLFLKDELTALARSGSIKSKIFFQEKTVRTATRISFALLLSVLAFLLFTWKKLPPEIPLFYSLPWGEEQLSSPFFLLILPLGSLFFGILNFLLAVFSFERQPISAKILVWATSSLILLEAIALVKIVFLII